jgi:hypothetical protein
MGEEILTKVTTQGRALQEHFPDLGLIAVGGTAVALHCRHRYSLVDGLLIPSAAEMLRIKAYLLAERRATRDYVDVAALALHLGEVMALQSLRFLNRCYPETGAQTAATRFAEACEVQPLDWNVLPLEQYQGLQAPLTDWEFVAGQCKKLGRTLIKLELTEGLPTASDLSSNTSGGDL